MSLTIDVEVLKKIKERPNFNASAYVERKLRELLEM